MEHGVIIKSIERPKLPRDILITEQKLPFKEDTRDIFCKVLKKLIPLLDSLLSIRLNQVIEGLDCNEYNLIIKLLEIKISVIKTNKISHKGSNEFYFKVSIDISKLLDYIDLNYEKFLSKNQRVKLHLTKTSESDPVKLSKTLRGKKKPANTVFRCKRCFI